jgi:beta-lactamase regulating signal transducer with metallopeptidase domain
MIGWLLDTLLYTGLLIALVLVLRRPVGKWFGPQLAYTLWALPFLRLLLPPIVLPASFAPAPEPVLAAVTSVPASASIPATAEILTAVVVVRAPAPAAAVPEWTAAPAWEWADLLAIGFSVWLGGALAFLAWRVVTYRRMRRELLADARAVGEIGKVRLVETPAIAAPVAFGVRDKVIALPPLFMAQPDIMARDLAIAHELAHHRGHDLLANFAAQALLALHWCNPLAWYGWRAMRRDQEAACDARVVAGRGREERALYAALIADIAAGPRLALAAPMACPVLGDKSIIHRLKSLSMSDMSPRRRLLGRSLVGAAALALPLTASFSYASAQVTDPLTPPMPVEPSAAPETVRAFGDVSAPETPATPDAVPAESPEGRHIVLRRQGEDGKPVLREFTLRREDGAPMPPNAPHFEFHGQGNWADPDFEAKMEAWGQEMEKWGKEWGEKWGRQYSEQAQAQAAQARAQAAQERNQALAEAAQARSAARAEAAQARSEARVESAQARAQALAWNDTPRIVRNCDGNERGGPRTENGRKVVVICQPQVSVQLRSSLRQARDSIASNPQLSPDIRDEILADLDDEIERIERQD